MMFILGYVAGLVTATLILVILTYYRRVIEKQLTIVEKYVENAGPRPRGSVFMPPDEGVEARERIIEENDKQGKDTRIADLI